MKELPQGRYYTESHEWIKEAGEGQLIVGITDYAQSNLGDIVFVELPELEEVEAGSDIAVLESVKAAADVYTPLKGTILEVNENLNDSPETINQDPYEKGWIFKISKESESFQDGLMSHEDYMKLLNKES